MSIRTRRPGFTLIELLVVIAIIGVLVGLLLPAINSAREAGRRTQCINNQRQIGLAIQGYLNARNTFPNSVTWGTTNNGDEITNFGADNLARVATAGTGGLTHDVGPLYSWVVDILPYIEQQSLYNDYDRNRVYYAPEIPSGGTNNNLTVSSTDIGILTCPNDDSLLQNQGNLTYVCNSGFNRAWWTRAGWNSNASGGATGGTFMDWNEGDARKSGLMWPGTLDGNTARDYKTTIAAVTDGLSTTLLISENIRAGASVNSPHAQGATAVSGQPPTTNWACAHPNFVAFTASDNVCSGPAGGSTCTTVNDLRPVPDPATGKVVDGPGWARANQIGSFENIGYGRTVPAEGGHPYINSLHPGIFVAVFCDGSTRVISETIDGTVFAKIVTPGGQSMTPTLFKHLPVDNSAIGQ